jgi:hypothetical protein
LDLSLRFTDNGRLHDDVELRVDGHTWVCDSYYFAIDRKLLPGREDDPKIKAVLRRLLEQWVSAVQSLPDAGVVFLPYDFSDECTGWLSCRRSGTQIEVCRGWASVPGYSFSPCDIGPYLTGPSGFAPDAGTTSHTTIDALADAIRRSTLNLS